MEIRPIRTWDEFVETVEDLHVKRDADAEKAVASVSELLYRGQPSSVMPLQTTLERVTAGRTTLSKYYRFVRVIKAKIESVTGRDWRIPSLGDFDQWIEKQLPPLCELPGYAFLAHLRHHGLPSPLLDWTKSPYVAAHFAMAPPPRKSVTEPPPKK